MKRRRQAARRTPVIRKNEKPCSKQGDAEAKFYRCHLISLFPSMIDDRDFQNSQSKEPSMKTYYYYYLLL
jgi:hypothetical protein